MDRDLSMKLQEFVQDVRDIEAGYWDMNCYLTDAQNIINANTPLITEIFLKVVKLADVDWQEYEDPHIAAKELAESYLGMSKVTVNVVTAATELEYYTWEQLETGKNSEIFEIFAEVNDRERAFWLENNPNIGETDLKLEISDAFEEILLNNGYIFYFCGDFGYFLAKVTE